MTIAFPAKSTVVQGTGPSIELTLPTNNAGELILAFGMCGDDVGGEGSTININETGYGNQVVSNNGSGSDSSCVCESKFSTGGESGTLTLEISAGAYAMKGQTCTASGVHVDVWDTAAVVGTGSANANSYATPAITTVTNNAVVLSVIHKEDFHSGTFTPPAGYTMLIDPADQTSNPRLGVAYKLIESPGTETPGTWGGISGSTSDWKGFTAALKAEVAGHPAMSRSRGIPGMNSIASRFGRGW